MLLSEMSVEYRRSQIALRTRIRELREAAKAAADPGDAAAFEARAKDLYPLYRETRALAELTARYYERSYHKNERFSL